LLWKCSSFRTWTLCHIYRDICWRAYILGISTEGRTDQSEAFKIVIFSLSPNIPLMQMTSISWRVNVTWYMKLYQHVISAPFECRQNTRSAATNKHKEKIILRMWNWRMIFTVISLRRNVMWCILFSNTSRCLICNWFDIIRHVSVHLVLFFSRSNKTFPLKFYGSYILSYK
jgi:hypothetical protein